MADSGRNSFSGEEYDGVDDWRVLQASFGGGGPSRRLLSACRCSTINKLDDVELELIMLENGSLAVEGGRDIVPIINSLLSLPFALKIATKDVHPRDHISFAASHPPPNNKAFQSVVKISNPLDRTHLYEIPLWPVHCVKGTKGAEIIPELDVSKLDEMVEKGKDGRSEMFSGFADVFGSKSSEAASHDLAGLLHRAGITTVFIAGLAGDYCVKFTALDAKKEGFEVYVVQEATRSVDAGKNGWGSATKDMEKVGIEIISVEGPEMERVKSLK